MITKDLIVENTSLEEFFSIINDLVKNTKVQKMKIYNQHAHTSCYKHCMQVAYYTYIICKKLNLDYVSATRGAMLHDLFLYDWHTHAKETGEHFHGFTHPRRALANAEKYFDLTDKEKDMILRHMWPLTPVPPKSREGLAIIYADKFCGLAETAARVKRWVLYSLRAGRTA